MAENSSRGVTAHRHCIIQEGETGALAGGDRSDPPARREGPETGEIGCSVEKLPASLDHDIVGHGFQARGGLYVLPSRIAEGRSRSFCTY